MAGLTPPLIHLARSMQAAGGRLGASVLGAVGAASHQPAVLHLRHQQQLRAAGCSSGTSRHSGLRATAPQLYLGLGGQAVRRHPLRKHNHWSHDCHYADGGGTTLTHAFR